MNTTKYPSAERCNEIFAQSIIHYHVTDNVDTPIVNPFVEDSIEYLLYLKNWIDTVQWHLEDLIRSPQIASSELVALKRRIDSSNQHRTDTVEKMDDWFVAQFASVQPKAHARMNSETPAWLLDRMSILMLKIYHMQEQTERTDADTIHIQRCSAKLVVLNQQKIDMAQCYDELMHDIEIGDKYMKVYRQMKMYNDASLNPVLYAKK